MVVTVVGADIKAELVDGVPPRAFRVGAMDIARDQHERQESGPGLHLVVIFPINVEHFVGGAGSLDNPVHVHAEWFVAEMHFD